MLRLHQQCTHRLSHKGGGQVPGAKLNWDSMQILEQGELQQLVVLVGSASLTHKQHLQSKGCQQQQQLLLRVASDPQPQQLGTPWLDSGTKRLLLQRNPVNLP